MSIEEIIYGDDGVLNRFRNGDYTISNDEKNTIIEFARKVNSDVKEGILKPQVFAIYSDIMYFFIHYANEIDELEEFIEKIYCTVQDGFDFEEDE